MAAFQDARPWVAIFASVILGVVVALVRTKYVRKNATATPSTPSLSTLLDGAVKFVEGLVGMDLNGDGTIGGTSTANTPAAGALAAGAPAAGASAPGASADLEGELPSDDIDANATQGAGAASAPPYTPAEAPEPASAPCARYPEDGKCADGFVLADDGCCVLPASEDSLNVAEVALNIAASVVAGEVLEASLNAVIYKKLTMKVVAQMYKGGARAAIRGGAKAVKGAAKSALGVFTRSGAKAAATGAKTGAKASTSLLKTFTNPLFVGMLAFDVFSMVLDFADVEGYNNYSEARVVRDALSAIEAQMQNIALQTGEDYPFTFPIELMFPAEWMQSVTPALIGHGVDGLTDAQRRVIHDASEELGIPDEILSAIDENVNRDPKKRDRIAFDALRAALPAAKRDLVENVPELSTALRRGVTLSKRGVRVWNSLHRKEWFRYHDLFGKPDPMPEGHQDSPVAVYTDTYHVLNEADPGTSDKPNLLTKKLARPAALMLMAGSVVSYCEKRKDIKDERDTTPCPSHPDAKCRPVSCDAPTDPARPSLCHVHTTERACAEGASMVGKEECRWIGEVDGGVDPREFGVYFDDGTGEMGSVGCVYTDGFCTRMGMKHRFNFYQKRSDCWKDGGQDVSEMMFGTTITRGIQRFFHNALGFSCTRPHCKPTEYCEGAKINPSEAGTYVTGFLWRDVPASALEDKTRTLLANEMLSRALLEKRAELLPAGGTGPVAIEFSQGEWAMFGVDDVKASHYVRAGDLFYEPAPEIDIGQSNCNPKMELGKHVGPAASWKCLSGHEANFHCVECRDVDEDCDGIEKTQYGEDCTQPGDCFCQPLTANYIQADGSRRGGNNCTKKRKNCLPTHKSEEVCPWRDTGCDDDKHCADGYCERVAGQINACRRHDSVKDREDGEFSRADDQCKSGLSAHHMCVPRIPACTDLNCWQHVGCAQMTCGGAKPATAMDYPCNRDLDCEENAYCDKVAAQRNTCRKKDSIKNRPDGEFCKRDDHCASGLCASHRCVPRIRACTDLNCWQHVGCAQMKCNTKPASAMDYPCNRDLDCESSAYCDKVAAQRNTCRKKPGKRDQPRGAFCKADDWCANGGICRNFRCHELKNEWKNCWEPCGHKGGLCSFCGADGACCRHNEERGRPECQGHGPAGWHSCIERKDGKVGAKAAPPAAPKPAAAKASCKPRNDNNFASLCARVTNRKKCNRFRMMGNNRICKWG